MDFGHFLGKYDELDKLWILGNFLGKYEKLGKLWILGNFGASMRSWANNGFWATFILP